MFKPKDKGMWVYLALLVLSGLQVQNIVSSVSERLQMFRLKRADVSVSPDFPSISKVFNEIPSIITCFKMETKVLEDQQIYQRLVSFGYPRRVNENARYEIYFTGKGLEVDVRKRD